MSKFDVNKIITESICENAITEELEIMKGWYGNKLYDKWNPEKDPPAFKIAKKLAAERKANADNLARIEKEGKEIEAKEAEAEEAKKLDTDSFQGKDAANVRADKLLKAEEAAREASNAEHAERATVGHHAKEYANELWSKTKKFGQDNFTLDPDKIDLPKTGMTGAAIAAGLGALALRRRMKNAKRK